MKPQTENFNAAQDQQDQGADKTRKSKNAFRTISEVANDLGVQQHVLRFWETKFSQIRPLKRGGGRRYYRPEDVELLKRIHELLYTQGYTIKGVQKLFRQNGKTSVMEGDIGIISPEKPQAANSSTAALAPKQKELLRETLAELKGLKALIDA